MTEERSRNHGTDEPPHATARGEQRLYDAIKLFLEAGESGADAQRSLLELHPELRNELSPLVDASATKERGTSATQVDTDAPASTLAPGERIGDYRLVKVLGEGGMGVVYEAEQISLRRPVALKLLSAGAASIARRRARFRREAEAGSRVRHKNIVAVYAVGEHAGVPFIAQELVDGGLNLAHWIADRKRSRAECDRAWQIQIARYFADAARAVFAAHEAGVLHRDLKPKNLLIGAGDEAKVADFGLAWMRAESEDLEISASGDQVGTPHYMSPEQIDPAFGEVDERSDVFSLGAALFEALTLEKPFPGEAHPAIFRAILADEVHDPREIAPALDRDLAAICQKALERRRVRRYPTMRAFAEDLERWLAGEPVSARPATVVDRATRVVRRNLAGFVAAAVLVIATFIALEAHRRAEENDRRVSAALAGLKNILVTELFDPDVLSSPSRFASAVRKTRAQVIEAPISDAPAVAAELLEAVGVAAIHRESSVEDRTLARSALADAAATLERSDLVGAALLALRAERVSQDAGDREEAAALRATWLEKLDAGKSAEARLARQLFAAEADIAAILRGEWVESEAERLHSLVDRLAQVDGSPRIVRASREIAASLCEIFERHEDAVALYRALDDSAGSRPVDELDRLEWRSRGALELAFLGDAATARAQIQECLTLRQQWIGTSCVGYRQDELRAAKIDYDQGDILGLATTLDRILDQFEKCGRATSEDSLYGLRLLCSVRLRAAESADETQREFAWGAAKQALERALEITRLVRGESNPTVQELATELENVRVRLEELR